jgi:ectoine hydroxylase-related dioxygenase (phytanoyl-CoA dioxygenase family)
MNLALFGESSFALFCSSLLLILSFAISLYADGNLPKLPWDLSPSDRAYKQLEPLPAITPPKIFHVDNLLDDVVSEEMYQSFHRDGVIAVRGLLDPALLSALDGATEEIIVEQRKRNEERKRTKPKLLTGRKKPPKQFFTVNQGTMFLELNDENSTSISPFVDVAMMSKIPHIVAGLLDFDCDTCANRTLRVLRDIFLAKDEEEYVCGWHVDDIGFWPALVEEPGEPVGINAWIALDDMPVDGGGGFALAVGSHSASWKEVAYASIGSTHSYPSEGFESSRDILQRRPGNGTCNIQHTAPHLHRRMEETKRIYEIKAGDVIFHTRWLFHRTIPFDRDKISSRTTNEENGMVYRRYSIRYGPGTSIIPPGYGTEPSVISDDRNGGRSADHVSQYDSAWYPRAWPSASDFELQQMKVLAKERLPKALEKSEQRKRVIRPRVKRQNAAASQH